MGVSIEIFKVHTFFNMSTTPQAFFFYITLKRSLCYEKWYQFHFSMMICVGIITSVAVFFVHDCTFFSQWFGNFSTPPVKNFCLCESRKRSILFMTFSFLPMTELSKCWLSEKRDKNLKRPCLSCMVDVEINLPLLTLLSWDNLNFVRLSEYLFVL